MTDRADRQTIRETGSGTDCRFSCYLRPLAGSAHTWSASWHTETDTKPSSAKSQRAKEPKSKKPLANCPSGLFNSGSNDCNSKFNCLQRRSCNCSCHLFAILFSPLKVNLSCSFSCGFVFRTLCALIVFKVRPAAAGAAYPRVGQTWIYHPQQWTNCARPSLAKVKEQLRRQSCVNLALRRIRCRRRRWRRCFYRLSKRQNNC